MKNEKRSELSVDCFELGNCPSGYYVLRLETILVKRLSFFNFFQCMANEYVYVYKI